MLNAIISLFLFFGQMLVYSKTIIYDIKDYTYFLKFNLTNKCMPLLKITQKPMELVIYSQNTSDFNDWIISQKNKTVLTNSIPVYTVEKEITFIDHHFNLKFYIVDNAKYAELLNYGKIPLPFKFNDTKISLVHQMKKKGLISEMSYSFDFTDYNSSIISFGGSPPKKRKYFSYCNVDEDSEFWNCRLDKIYFFPKEKSFTNYESSETQEISYEINSVVLFDVEEFESIVSMDFILVLKEGYFGKYFPNDCEFVSTKIESFFVCSCHIIDEVPDFNFVIEKTVYTVKSQNLFNIEQDLFIGSQKCYSTLKTLNDEPNLWVLGQNFISKFPIEFNYEKKKVIFFSNVPPKNFIIINKKEWAIIINSFLLFFSTIINIYIKTINKS